MSPTNCRCQYHNTQIQKDSVPIERIKIWLRTLPQWILTGIILRINHSTVDPTIKISQKGRVHPLPRYPNRSHLLRPNAQRDGMCSREVEIWNFRFCTPACLFAADEADADTGLDRLVGCVIESDKRAALVELDEIHWHEEMAYRERISVYTAGDTKLFGIRASARIDENPTIS